MMCPFIEEKSKRNLINWNDRNILHLFNNYQLKEEEQLQDNTNQQDEPLIKDPTKSIIESAPRDLDLSSSILHSRPFVHDHTFPNHIYEIPFKETKENKVGSIRNVRFENVDLAKRDPVTFRIAPLAKSL